MKRFLQYPLAYCVHFLQGGLGGFLCAYAIHKQESVCAVAALPFTLMFLAYEALEQQRISDDGDTDVKVFGSGLLILFSLSLFILTYFSN